MKRIIFVGSQNLGGLLDDGEVMKNHYLKMALKPYVSSICEIDVRNKPSRVLYLVKFLFNILFCRKSIVVMSSSPYVADSLFKIMRIVKWNSKQVYYWVIGGSFGKKMQDGEFNTAHYRDFASIMVEGSSMTEQLKQCGLQNVRRVPNFKEVSYLPEKRINLSAKTRFVFLSRIMAEKGCNYILEASNLLVDEGIKNFSVDFYGRLDNEYKDDFLKKVEGSDNLRYAGFLNLKENQGYDKLSEYDAMLFPTYWHGEGFPGIIIDAYIAGLPVIASDWNLNRDLVKDGETGLLINVHDSVALSRAMKRIIMKEVDIDNLSSNSQKEAMRYDLHNVVSKDLLTEIGLYK